MRRVKLLGVAVVLALVAAAGVAALRDSGDYRLNILMPSAGQTFVGAAVVINGEQVGQVSDLGVEGDRAVVTVDIDDAAAPLREGTQARITWESVIGAQVVELMPGPARNVALPSGKRIVSGTESVQVDDVLAALDPATREHLQGVVGELQTTLAGREQAVKSTLDTAGPAVEGMGEVLRAVGDDGPAIKQLVTQLRGMAGELAKRDEELGSSVSNVDRFTSVVAERESSVGDTLAKLPGTVDEATATLRRVPGAVGELDPLLGDLRPATARLPETARNLSPVLTDLRASVANLKPTLGSLDVLLGRTPQLLDGVHSTVPGVTQAVDGLQPAVSFLRPYAPETAGWLSNWVSIFGSQASTGRHIARALITGSSTSWTDNPGVLPPGVQQDPRPKPGEIAGQPWLDANGDGVR